MLAAPAPGQVCISALPPLAVGQEVEADELEWAAWLAVEVGSRRVLERTIGQISKTPIGHAQATPIRTSIRTKGDLGV